LRQDYGVSMVHFALLLNKKTPAHLPELEIDGMES
jgi:hypothetical protein